MNQRRLNFVFDYDVIKRTGSDPTNDWMEEPCGVSQAAWVVVCLCSLCTLLLIYVLFNSPSISMDVRNNFSSSLSTLSIAMIYTMWVSMDAPGAIRLSPDPSPRSPSSGCRYHWNSDDVGLEIGLEHRCLWFLLCPTTPDHCLSGLWGIR